MKDYGLISGSISLNTMDFKKTIGGIKERGRIFWLIAGLSAGFSLFSVGYMLGGHGLSDASREKAAGNRSSSSDTAKVNEFRRKGSSLTSPLLECSKENELLKGDVVQIRNKVQNLVYEKIKNNQAEHISIYFRDLNNGPTFGINEKETFSPASLLKVPIMIALYKMEESDPGFGGKKFVYHKNAAYPDSSLQNVKPSIGLEEGKEYSIDEMVRIMIVYSDNNATSFLLEKVDKNILQNTHKDLGANIYSENNDVIISVKNYAAFFRILYNASYLNEAMSEKALKLLSELEFKDGIAAGVPKDVTVARKFGEKNFDGKLQLHDCGIIYHPKKPFLLCVMTKGDDFKKLGDTIGELTKVVYDGVNSGSR